MIAPIPTTQQGAVVLDPGPSYRIVHRDDLPVPTPGDHEVLVKLSCTGLCHSEIRATLNWSTYNPIIGHEGIGTVVQLGPHTSPALLGHRVGVKWLYSACATCSVCTRGHPHYCPHQRNTSRHVPGTLQQYVLADARFLTPIPTGVADEIAAPLLCAGLTMAGALGRLDGVVRAGEVVVISGAGGGLGHLGVQLAARVKGLRVIAVDTGAEKQRLSLAAGAERFVDFRTEDVVAAVREWTGGEGAHATIVVPGTEAAFAMAPELVRNMGYVVCVGLPRNDIRLPVSATLCAARGISIIGSSVGTEAQMEELLQLAAQGVITPEVRTYAFQETEALIRGLEKDTITGRAVVQIPQ
ncbi:zinc-dependent alcohol dehydrogenase [Aspergillus saccharolyticus JOP 1030-1]|uniref:Putative quinone oxidoreductase n=1 Tax=Aspergillus saccharolyticus JOP 1030-1 TaxID=1450539 RepID=A0A318Z1B9_9EURO|nr:putative quinone oxidoreductase [Aspergillus saccharolyticus JOP 1030-1]PYH40709.1 putative quinone oxidoreductase [Aspergillus saccharolyticus JOP 1030-1]